MNKGAVLNTLYCCMYQWMRGGFLRGGTMELRVAAVDDLASDRELLVNGLRSYEEAHSDLQLAVTTYTDADSFLADPAYGSYDLVFLDIYMGAMNGIELARRLRATDARQLIVFCTTSLDHTFDAMPLHPFDYLVKPYETARLHAVLDEAMRVLATPGPVIEVRVPRSTQQVPLGKIVTADSKKHSTELRLSDGNVLRCAMSFSQISELLLCHKRFMLINRGSIINMDEVRSHNGEEFLMKDGSARLMRARGRAQLLQQFSHYTLMHLGEAARL